jgi:hypothetical protein
MLIHLRIISKTIIYFMRKARIKFQIEPLSFESGFFFSIIILFELFFIAKVFFRWKKSSFFCYVWKLRYFIVWIIGDLKFFENRRNLYYTNKIPMKNTATNIHWMFQEHQNINNTYMGIMRNYCAIKIAIDMFSFYCIYC